MTTVDISELGLHLGDYLEMVKAGETVVIAEREQPIAELRPSEPRQKEPRPFGLCKGEIWIADDFDAPLPADVLKDFYGE